MVEAYFHFKCYSCSSLCDRHFEETRWHTPLIQTFIRMHNDKNSAMIVDAAVYIAVNEKHTNFCIYGWMLLKILVIFKKVSNKSCSELNFVQKSSRVHMCISLQSGARGPKRLLWLKYYIILKRQITFNLGLNATRNTHHIEKSLK